MPAKPLAIRLAHLLGGLVVHHRRAGDRHQHDRDVVLAGRADGEPAEVAQLGQRDVGADLHAELLGVEGERLVLVVDPQLGVGDPDHRGPPWVDGTVAGDARPAPRRCLLETCGVAGGRRRARRRPGRSACCGGRREAPRGRRSATCRSVRVKLVVNEPTLCRPTEKQMSATERSVVAQQRRGALEPAGQQVGVRRLAEGAPELAAEVRAREAGRARPGRRRRAARSSGRRRGPWRAAGGGRAGRTPCRA